MGAMFASGGTPGCRDARKCHGPIRRLARTRLRLPLRSGVSVGDGQVYQHFYPLIACVAAMGFCISGSQVAPMPSRVQLLSHGQSCHRRGMGPRRRTDRFDCRHLGRRCDARSAGPGFQRDIYAFDAARAAGGRCGLLRVGWVSAELDDGATGRRPGRASWPPPWRPAPGGCWPACARRRCRPRLIALRTRCLSRPPSSSRFGPVTPFAWTAASVWQLLQFWTKRSLPSSSVARRLLAPERADAALRLAARGDHGGRHDDAEREVEDEDREREELAPARQVHLARRTRPAGERDEEDRDARNDERGRGRARSPSARHSTCRGRRAARA